MAHEMGVDEPVPEPIEGFVADLPYPLFLFRCERCGAVVAAAQQELHLTWHGFNVFGVG